MYSSLSKKKPSVDYLGETSFQATTVNTSCQRFHYLYQRRRHLYVTDSLQVIQQHRYRSPYAQAYLVQCGTTSVKHNTTKEANTFYQRGISTVAISGWTNHFWRSHDSLSHRVTLAQSDENCTVKRPPQGTPGKTSRHFCSNTSHVHRLLSCDAKVWLVRSTQRCQFQKSFEVWMRRQGMLHQTFLAEQTRSLIVNHYDNPFLTAEDLDLKCRPWVTSRKIGASSPNRGEKNTHLPTFANKEFKF